MNNWDQYLTYGIVICAALYLLGRQFSRRRSACGGCHGCASGSDDTFTQEPETVLVQIEMPPRTEH